MKKSLRKLSITKLKVKVLFKSDGRSKENYSYLEGSESVEFLESKLRGCQEEIECFKDLVRELIDSKKSLKIRNCKSLKKYKPWIVPCANKKIQQQQ